MTDEELNRIFAKSTAEIASLAAEGRETERLLKETERALKEMFAETDRKMQETDLKMQETDRQIQETGKQIQETSRQMKETDLKMQETSRQMKETDRKMAKVFEKIGGIDDNIGHHAEQFFQNVFADSKVFGGINYDDIILNMRHKDKSGEVEFDIVLENGNAVALIEVKNRIHPDFVKNLAEERIAKFRKHFPVYKGFDIYLGIAGFSFSEAVLEEARRYGVGIVRQAGDGVEVDATALRAYH